MSMKKLCALLLGITLALPAALNADDTDIYFRPNVATSSKPLVIFSIDYRSNLVSVICTNPSSDLACPQAAFFRQPSIGLAGKVPTDKLLLFDVIILSLEYVLKRTPGIRIALKLNHNNTNNCSGPNNAINNAVSSTTAGCSNGGYIAMGFTEILPDDTTGTVTRFVDILTGMKQRQAREPTSQHPHQGKELYFEFFRYLTGGRTHNAHNAFTDYANECNQPNNATNALNLCQSTTTRVTKNLDDTRLRVSGNSALTNTFIPGSRVSWDTTIESSSDTSCGGINQRPCRETYTSPFLSSDACAKVFAVNFMFGTTNSEDDSDAAITATSGGMTGINLAGTNNSFATVIRYMFERDLDPDADGVQNVTSYFIVPPTQINNTTNGYARAGGTGGALPLAEDPGELIEDLQDILRDVLSVSSTIVAASVPVNVFNRATVVDNVFIALFQADSEGRPAWPGNLKKLKFREVTLADDTTDIALVDANETDAVANDGRIKFDALTFWTDPATLPVPTAAQTSEENIFPGKDGRHIPRGGAGQMIPGYVTNAPTLLNSTADGRKMFYPSGSTLAALNADSATATALKPLLTPGLLVLDNTEALNLLKFMRGVDVFDEDTDSNVTEARQWTLGDPLHSRPLPINYGALSTGFSETNPAIFIAMGSNDGFMHLFKNTNADGSESGREMWAFAPTEVMGMQRALAANVAQTPPRHYYGVDGAAAVFQGDIGGVEKTYLYFGLRRGGKAYYALDITDPEAPELLWKVDPSNSDFAELSFTFSTPRIGYVRIASDIVPVVVFGGGYDTDNDYQVPNLEDDAGRAVYVVNAVDGTLIWKAVNGGTTGASGNVYSHADLDDSVPSDITVVDTNGDGLLDRLLFGDTGGNVWRADLQGVFDPDAPAARFNPDLWKLSKLASLGYHAASGSANDRRFFHAPDIALTRDSTGAFDAVLIGSGDRENPLDFSHGTTPQNFFYMIKDRRTFPRQGLDSTTTHATLTDITALTPATARSVTIPVGWKLRLQEGDGEKSLAAPVTFQGSVFFTTFLPDGSVDELTCGPKEGSGVLYVVSLFTGAATQNFDTTDDADTTSTSDRTTALASGGIPAQVVFLPTGAGGSGGMSYLTSDLDVRAGGSNRLTSFWQRVE